MYIAIEGPDGVGTTLQSRRLATRLAATLTCEPTPGILGQQIREDLARGGEMDDRRARKLAALFAADRLVLQNETLAPLLLRGQTVVSDRCYLSSLVYQGLHLPIEALRALNSLVARPDLLIVLRADLDVCMARIAARKGRDVFEQRPVQAKVHRAYDALGFAERAIFIDEDGRTEDEVGEEIYARVPGLPL